MTRLRDHSLGVKLAIGFGCVICIMAAVNVALLREVGSLRGEIVELTTSRLPRIITTFDLSLNLANLRTGQLQQAITGEPAARRRQASEMVQLLDRISVNLAYYDSVRHGPRTDPEYAAREETLYVSFDESWEQYQDLFFEIVAHSEAGEEERALAVLNGPARAVYNRMNAALDQLVQLNREEFRDAAQEAESAYQSTRRIITLSLVASLAVSLLAAVALVRMVARPVGELARAVHRVAQGDLGVQLEPTSRDEIGRLSTSFNQMTHALRRAREESESHNREISHANIELERQLLQIQELSARNLEQERALRREMEKELDTAHRMQMALMPERSPEITGYDVAGRCLPATQVGGDCFQFFQRPVDSLSICLSDVSGHAMEAAIPMVLFSGILESEIGRSTDLAELYAQLNATLHRILETRVFVCFLMGEVQISERRVRLANSGCPYPLVYTAHDGAVRELELVAYPLGVAARTRFPVAEVQLAPGDRIAFCSDGFVEATNGDNEMFGFERVARIIQQACSRGCAADEVIDHLVDAVRAYTGTAAQEDDQTIVVLGPTE